MYTYERSSAVLETLRRKSLISVPKIKKKKVRNDKENKKEVEIEEETGSSNWKETLAQ